MTSRRSARPRVWTNAAGYASEGLIRLVLAGIVGVIVARYLGPTQLGLLSFVSGTYALLAPLSRLGLPQVLVREFSTQRDWEAVMSSAVGVQIPVAALSASVGLAIISMARFGDRDAMILAATMLPLPFLALAESVRAYHESHGHLRRIVVVGVTSTCLTAAMRLTAVAADAEIWVFGAIAGIEVVVLTIGLSTGLPSRIGIRAIRVRFERGRAAQLLHEAWPLLLSGLAITVYMKADLLMLGMLTDNRETGIYAAAARLSEVWYFVPAAVMAAARPQLARLFAAGEMSRYARETRKIMVALVGLSYVALVLIMLLGERLIAMVYGSAYNDATAVLQVHILSAPFVFIGVVSSQSFIDHRLTRTTLVRSVIGAAVNVVMNLALIPIWGAVGAAVSTLVAYALSAFILNAIGPSTRAIFALQLRSFALLWPRSGDGPS